MAKDLIKDFLEEIAFWILKVLLVKCFLSAQYNARKLASIIKVSDKYLRIITITIRVDQV
jgi:hypothetical protein